MSTVFSTVSISGFTHTRGPILFVKTGMMALLSLCLAPTIQAKDFSPPSDGRLIWSCEGRRRDAGVGDEWFSTHIDPSNVGPWDSIGIGGSLPPMNQPECDALPLNPPPFGSVITGGVEVGGEQFGACDDIPRPEGAELCVNTTIWYQDATTQSTALLGVAKDWYTDRLSKQKVRVRFRGLDISLTLRLTH